MFVCDVFLLKSVHTAIHSIFLLLGGKKFWHHFSTHLFPSQIVVQNLSNTFLTDVIIIIIIIIIFINTAIGWLPGGSAVYH